MSDKVTVTDLKKHYGPVEAVRGVSFSIGEGEIFGLLGPNGAGKTTTLECMIGLREADGGNISVCGLDARRDAEKIKEKIGVQFQATALHDKITPREALTMFAAFYDNPADVEELIKRFSLGEKANSYFANLSGGQKQRLAVALAFINRPELVLLDEPTTGLDAQARRELHGLIGEMRREGRTLLLTTHYIEEAENLCDRVAIVDHGRIVACGAPAELIAKSKTLTRVTIRTSQQVDPRNLKSLACVQSVEELQGRQQLATVNVSKTVMDLARMLEAGQIELLDLHVEQPSLEDVFLELTGTRLRE